jgi:murein L,D-transpeptidase YafK
MKKTAWGSRLFALALTASSAAVLAACDDYQVSGGSGRSLRPIPPDTIALMEQKDTTPSAPVLIRTYKKEAELEIWKMKSDGHYTLLKTFPMCRWSGQLGPKTREGDMQVPEGFYTIAPGQMNPNSNYYLSFNVGYPNAYDRAFGRTGGNIMVHGVCSSAGCFSMTDKQIAEIYAIAREAFNGGQHAIQMQSYPFHMTAENFAKHRYDPNIDFWKQLKVGADHFEVTKTEPGVGVCGKHYVFDATTERGSLEPSAPCPALKHDDAVEAAVAEKQAHDEAQVAELIKQGVKPIKLVYSDGGQNVQFRGQPSITDVSDPDALMTGPAEVVIDEHGQPVPTVVKVAEADAARAATATAKPATIVGASQVAKVATAPQSAPPQTPVQQQASAQPAAAPAPTETASNGSPLSNVFGSAGVVKKWFSFGSSDNAAANDVKVYEPAEPVPTDVPLPPRRDAAMGGAPAATPLKPQASASPLRHVAASTSPLLTLVAAMQTSGKDAQ